VANKYRGPVNCDQAYQFQEELESGRRSSHRLRFPVGEVSVTNYPDGQAPNHRVLDGMKLKEKRMQSEFDVILETVGNYKIPVIKVAREIVGIGLKEAKDLVDGAPQPVLEKVAREAAELAKAKLEAAGATVTVKSRSTPSVTGNGAVKLDGKLVLLPVDDEVQDAIVVGEQQHPSPELSEAPPPDPFPHLSQEEFDACLRGLAHYEDSQTIAKEIAQKGTLERAEQMARLFADGRWVEERRLATGRPIDPTNKCQFAAWVRVRFPGISERLTYQMLYAAMVMRTYFPDWKFPVRPSCEYHVRLLRRFTTPEYGNGAHVVQIWLDACDFADQDNRHAPTTADIKAAIARFNCTHRSTKPTAVQRHAAKLVAELNWLLEHGHHDVVLQHARGPVAAAVDVMVAGAAENAE
jgi:ribosomal protein L7/L12